MKYTITGANGNLVSRIVKEMRNKATINELNLGVRQNNIKILQRELVIVLSGVLLFSHYTNHQYLSLKQP